MKYLLVFSVLLLLDGCANPEVKQPPPDAVLDPRGSR
jgi:hypothetical protein